MSRFIYLACPYSHDDPAVREARFREVTRIAYLLIRDGELVYSPITHSHPIALHGLPMDMDYWLKHDLHYLANCSDIYILMLEGWDQSKGIKKEVEYVILNDQEIKISFVEIIGDSYKVSHERMFSLKGFPLFKAFMMETEEKHIQNQKGFPW